VLLLSSRGTVLDASCCCIPVLRACCLGLRCAALLRCAAQGVFHRCSHVGWRVGSSCWTVLAKQFYRLRVRATGREAGFCWPKLCHCTACCSRLN
jgi:hypothetical protein